MPRISVIIPTRSRPHLLPRAVESARLAGKDIEIIVVDDASIDTTKEVCQQLRDIKYVRLDRNQGVAGARNIGILASCGEFIAFLDDDDLRLPGSLNLQLKTLDSFPEAGLVCGSILLANQNYELTGESLSPKDSGEGAFWRLLELDFPMLPLSVLMRKECFFKVGLLSTRLQGIDDWDIFVRLAELYPVVVIDEPVGIYRQPTHFSGQGSSVQSTHLLRAIRHQGRLLQLPRALSASTNRRKEMRTRALKRVADTLLLNGARLLQEGQYRFAFSHLLTALRLMPSRALRPSAYKKFWVENFATR